MPKRGPIMGFKTPFQGFSKWGGGSQGGGNGPVAPSSVFHAVFPSDFTVNGSGQLTAVAPHIGNRPGAVNVVDTPSVDVGGTGGIIMTEANPARYVELDTTVLSEFQASFPSGAHLAVCVQRNATADTDVVLLATNNASHYAFAAQEGSSNATTAQQLALTRYRIDGVNYGPTTRGALWAAAMADTTTRAIGFQDVSTPRNIRLGFYGEGGNAPFNFEGYVLGWAAFDDWSQADDVAAYLTDNV